MNRVPVLFPAAAALIACALPAGAQEVTPAAPAPPAAAPLTLEDVQRIALGASPRVRQAQARVDRTEGQVQRAVAPFRRPTVTFTGSYSRLSTSGAQAGNAAAATPQNPFTVGLSGTTPGSQTVQLSDSTTGGASNSTTTTTTTTTRSRQATGGDGGGDGNTAAPAGLDLSQFGFSPALDQQSVGFSVAQRLDVTGLGRAYRRVGDAERAIARQELEQTRQEVAYSVATAYYDALRYDALIRVSEASVRQSEEQVRIAQARYEQGDYAKSDVLRARSQLANNAQSLISARNRAVIARSALANAMGVEPAAAPLALAPIDGSAPAPAVPELDGAALLARALSRRPEAVRAALNEAKAAGNLRIARQGQEPSLSASLNGTYNGTQGIASQQRATGGLGLAFSFPLSDGGVTAGGVRAARADQRIAAAQSEEYRNGIRAEVEQAVVALRDAFERAQSALPALEEAREGYRLSEARLKAGSGTQLSLYDAQATLVQAEVNAVNARYDYLGALARLARATGEPAPP